MVEFNVAILGAGHIAEKMATAINGIEEATLYAVASRSMDKAEDFAKKHGAQKAYGSYEEMLEDEKVDLVYVATPHSMHCAHAKLCIEYGRAVLVEKAFCANAGQAREVIELAREKKVFLAEAIWTRYLPAREELLHLIAEGTIGEVVSVEADFSIPISKVERLREPALAGGALLDLGMYCLTFASIFLGDDIEKIDSTCMKYETGVDATDQIIISYKNGKKAFLRTSMVSGSRNEGRINGTGGYIHVQNLNNYEEYEVYDKDGQLVKKVRPELRVNGYEYEILASRRCIEAGRLECPEMPHEEILLIMEQMDGLRRDWGIVYPFEEA